MQTNPSNRTSGFALVIALSFIAFGAHGLAQSVIPLPAQMETQAEALPFALTKSTVIFYNHASLKKTAELLSEQLAAITGKTLKTSPSKTAPKDSIFLDLNPSLDFDTDLPKQAYRLNSRQVGVHISASDNAGIFYGTVTLAQLLPVPSPDVAVTQWTIPVTRIEDAPSFPWRGMMFDVSRYFFSKEYVLRYLDMMAMHKLNVFHWHLIDDCGWRIEIKKYPKLTEVGAWRGEGDAKHGGFYTQEDIKEIVAYAAARNIEVVPEIEIPAHTLAALAAYPYLGCIGKEFTVPTRHSISPEIYCAGKETTWDFLQDVMDEVTALFPSSFVHIGGDEAKFSRWKSCPDCQKVMKDNQLKSEHALQGWMTTRIETYLETKGKRIIGWDEILDCGVSNKAGIMTWNKPSTAIDGAKRGNPVVMSLVKHTYFDTPESKLPGEPPCATWTPPVSLQKAYEWHPVPAGLTGDAAKNILGPNGCVWTDRFLHDANVLADKPGQGSTASEAYLDYISLPRMSSLAEVGWTPQSQRVYAHFTERMKVQYHRYLNRGYNFRMPTPLLNTKRDAAQNLIVSATAPVRGATVRYTTDGSEPTADSAELTNVVTVPKKNAFKAATFLSAEKHSLTYTYEDALNQYLKYGQVVGNWKAKEVSSATARTETFDATGLIDGNGTYEITFVFDRGRHKLVIDSVEIIRNDTDSMGKDAHPGVASKNSQGNVYTIQLNGYETGAAFKIKASISAASGHTTFGTVCIKKL